MKARQKTRHIAILSLLLVVALLAACDALPQSDDSNQLEASGVVEAVQVAVAPELGGRVAEVFVSEGDVVVAGDALFRLEDDVLEGQHRQAQAALEGAQADAETAQAALDMVNARSASAALDVEAAEAALDTAEAGVHAAQARLEAAQAAVANAELGQEMALSAARQSARPQQLESWNQELSADFNTPPWYFDEEETLQSTESEVAAAQAALERERAAFAAMMDNPRFQEVVDVAERLIDAQAAFHVAEDLLAREIGPTDPQQLEAYVQELYDAAQAELEAAQSAYDRALSDVESADVLEARARLAGAVARLDAARDRRDALLTGERSLSVRAAEAAVVQAQTQVAEAEAGVDQAEAARTQAGVAVAQAQAGVDQLQAAVAQAQTSVVRAEKAVAQAQAALDLVELQQEKLVVQAAVAGTVVTRDIQPGEVVQPGTTALTLGQLDELTVTVYLPENAYGRVSLGDSAQVSVDSFPERTFAATVRHIADEAEYTPRNVQTTEERQTTVYAVELALQEGQGQLKPGMPADVVLQ